MPLSKKRNGDRMRVNLEGVTSCTLLITPDGVRLEDVERYNIVKPLSAVRLLDEVKE